MNSYRGKTLQCVVFALGVTGSAGVAAADSAEGSVMAREGTTELTPLRPDLNARRTHAFERASAGDWAAAAEEFVALAGLTRAAVDRLAAQRSLAQIGKTLEAITQGEALQSNLADLPEPEAQAAVAELATLHTTHAYRLRAEGLALASARSLERALELDPSRVRLHADAGYAWLAAGDRDAAAEHFIRAIDGLSSDRPRMPAVPAAQSDDVFLVERLRRELRELRRQWTIAVFQSWRPSQGGPSAAFAGLQRDGLIAAQGGVELAWRAPSAIAGAGERSTELFLRTLWSQRGDALAIDGRSVQGTAGLRWQPIAGSALRISAEGLFAVGEAARNDWLLRVAWGHNEGDEVPLGRSRWTARSLYVDVGRFFRGDGSNAAYAEWREGVAFASGANWVVVPHLMVAGRAVRPDPFKESWAEAGPGIAWRRSFGGTAREADRGRIEIALQYRFEISGAARQGWMVTGALVW